jgi:hypothetical protein
MSARAARAAAAAPRARAARKKKPPALQGYSGGFGDLDKYPALVLHYSGGLRVLRFSA